MSTTSESSIAYDRLLESPTVIRDAGPPFDDLDADIIIRSSDGVDFLLYGIILAKASKVFKDMFSTPSTSLLSSGLNHHPEDDHKDGRPIIRLTENSHVLDMMFRLFYPVDRPKVTSISDIRLLLQALDKYLVDSLPETVEAILMDAVEREPQTICVIACRYDLTRVANAAAKLTLRDPLLYAGLCPSDDDLAYISAAKYRRILLYHQQCSERAAEAVQSLLWMDGRSIPSAVADGSPSPNGCTCSRGEKWAISSYDRKRGAPNISMYRGKTSLGDGTGRQAALAVRKDGCRLRALRKERP
ncbi:hypothetical protein EW146_g10326 [Bondarzewia mesenterica]|uniref:BTB domain-containing protein n=1 Tax=Bondarzewia mesenterica TaxID=1095465 RepID=A0A4S4KYT4_9AGAM|nr:hypothetical protein EW146_g10326 [Bondarzewia mesenterica]